MVEGSFCQNSSCSQPFLLVFLNHAIWSTQPIASRYLLVFAKPQVLDGLTVLATAKFTSGVLIFCASHLVFPETSIHPARPSSGSCSETTHGVAVVPPSKYKKFLYALAFGTAATCRAALNIASTKFTLSYYITTINSLNPIFVSLGDSLFLKTKLPRALWPAVLSSFVGCSLMSLSKASSDAGFTRGDFIGCTLQFGSMLCSAVARLLMKRTEGILTRNETVQTNNFCNTLFPLVYTLMVSPSGWKAFLSLTPQSWMAWLTISVLVYTIASSLQISLVRSVGSGVYSSFSAVRVILSACLSAIFLHEPVENGLEWLGLLITGITMTIYTINLLKPENTIAALNAGGESQDGNATSDAEMTVLIESKRGERLA